jgi:hypothetical protein
MLGGGRFMRGRVVNCLTLFGIIALVACANTPELPPVPLYDSAQLKSLQMRVVLVAGDASLRVFDNAVATMGQWLHDEGGVEPDRITRLSAASAIIEQQGAAPASLAHVIGAVENLKPLPGQGCLVFITSHGIRGEGVELSSSDVLRPEDLDRALARGCGNAPTVVIISACFSGGFAQPPMTRANRIVLTAAAANRASFGCRGGEIYTFFDQCLLGALHPGRRWKDLFAATLSCVEGRESGGQYAPSNPQAWFGPAVADMPLPEARRNSADR